MTDRLRRAAPVLVVGAVLLAAALPWWPLLDVLPQGADATKWVGRADLHADWFDWVWNRKHFVGWRPVTAFSFVLNHATTGFAAWGYRATDLGLHVLGAGLVLAVHRAWFGGSWLGTAAAGAVLLAHPAVEEVVPFPSRRSYLLAGDFGLAALLLHGAALSAPTRARRIGLGLATAAATLLAVTSNELAYVFPVLIALRTASEAWRRAPSVALPTVLATLTAIGLRARVLDTVGGGYQKHYVAILTANGAPAWLELPDWQPGRILASLVRYLFVPQGPSGEGPLLPVGAGRDALVLALATWVVAVAGLAPAVAVREVGARRRLLLGAWLVGAAGIVVLSQTWFWRQAFPMLVPLSLLAGAVVGDAVAAGTRRARLPALAVPALLAASVPFGAVLGLHLEPHLGGIRASALVTAVEALDLGSPSLAWLAVAERPQTAQIARIWLDRRAPDGRRHRVVATLSPRGLPDRARATIRAAPDGVRHLALRAMALSDPDRFEGLRDRGELRVDALWRRPRRPGHHTWLVVSDAAGVRAEALERPADGVLYVDDGREAEPEDEP